MANRRKKDDWDYLDELKELFDQTVFCCCPECGADCVVDLIDHGKDLKIRALEFTCLKCGPFAADYNLKTREWKLRNSDLLYLPCTEGNDFTLYQRFNEAAYPTRRKALEAKYSLMDNLFKPLLDNRMVEHFEKIDKEALVCCRELSDMGIAKYKGVLARLLLSRNANGLNPVTPLDGELLEEIESLVSETDFEGMIEALISLMSYEASGLESGINVFQWTDMLVRKCLEDTKVRSDSEKVESYLRVCALLETLRDIEGSHKLALMTVDLIKANISVLEDADELLDDAYSYTDPSLNTFEMSKEIFEHSRDRFEDCPEQYACALFEICLKTDEHPEVREQALIDLNRFITGFDEDLLYSVFLAKAHYVRYRVTGRSADLQKAFDIVVDDEFWEEPSELNIIIKYLRSIQKDSRRLAKALKKLGMSGTTADEAIRFLEESYWQSHNPGF